MSRIDSIGQAVAGAIQAMTLPEGTTVAFGHAPELDVSKVGDSPVINVVPVSQSLTRASRTSTQADLAFAVVVQRRVGSADPAAVGAMLDLMDEIASMLLGPRLPGAPEAGLVSIVNDPVMSRDDLVSMGVFSGVLTATFRTLT